MATSVAFSKNWQISKVLEAASWRSPNVFISFYLRDVGITIGELHSLGSFVAAGQLVNPSE